MGQTIVEKVAQAHMAEGPTDRPLRAGDFLTIRPRHVLTHDNTAPVMKKFETIGATRIADPSQPVFVLDHDIQNTSEENLAKYAAIEAFARRHGIDFYPAGTGIGHQVMVERLYAVPGALVVASDSHANMYGGVGALGTPVVRTDAAAIWATGTFWWQIPRTVRVRLEGEPEPGVTGKDVILALCGRYNRGEVLNAAVEFSGPGIAALSLEERLAIANMTTEWGALVGWFPVDAATLAFLAERSRILAERADGGAGGRAGGRFGGRADGQAGGRLGEAELSRWEREPPGPDPDATYAARIDLDLARVAPQVTGPDSVQVATPLSEIERDRIPIQKAYLVSCVNSRAEDIAAAAEVLEGRRVAEGVKLYVAAASREVQEESERRGTWQTLLAAGAVALPPGCGPCIGLGAGLLEAGETGISATNRNFKGRMGSREARCYLASPAVVAAAAATGFISAPPMERGDASSNDRHVPYRYREYEPPTRSEEEVEILPGFPARIAGRLVFLPPDNLNTDGIYGKDHTYRDDMTAEAMARVVFENYDPDLAGRLEAGDVIVGGFNFGTGSSREQAVTALQAKRISLLVAGSFSQTYLRNAFNNGFPCVECPEIVARLRERLAERVEAGDHSLIPGGEIEIEFSTGSIRFESMRFRFPPLGSVPQALVVAGGIENRVRTELGIR